MNGKQWVFLLGFMSVILPFGLLGQEVTVGTEAALRAAVDSVNDVGGPLTIYVQPGDYALTDALWVHASGVSVIGTGATRNEVIIRGRGMHDGSVPHGFWVAGNDCRFENLTIRNVYYHGIQLSPGADRIVVRNVRFQDTREQMLKGAFNGSTPSVTCDEGLVENCLFEYTAGIGPQYYIGGVDVHRGTNWVIRGNVFKSIKSPSLTVAEHAVHFWNFSTGTLVENNTIINCDRGIGFGLGSSGHHGGIIRNNMIYHDTTEGFADVGIALETCDNAQVYNNTVYFANSYPHAVEYRFSASTGNVIRNNLTNKLIRQRDGASATLSHNVTNAQVGWFVAPASGDLRLASRVETLVDQGETIAALTRDHEGDARPQGAGYDIGADEWHPSNQAPVLDPIGARSAESGQPISITVEASDADADPLEFAASGPDAAD